MGEEVLSPLFVKALEFNEWFCYLYYPFRIRWNIKAKRLERRGFTPGIFFYHFANLVVIPICLISCVHLIFDSLLHQNKYPIDLIYVYILSTVVLIAILATNFLVRRDCDKFCHALNSLFVFEKSTRPIQKQNIRSKYSSQNGATNIKNMDWIGAYVFTYVVVVAFGPFVLPFVGVAFGLDPFYYILKQMLPLEERSVTTILLVFSLRFFLVTVCCIEASKTVTMGVCYTIATLMCYDKVVTKLTKARDWKSSLRLFNQLSVIHSSAGDIVSEYAALYFSLIYFGLIDVNVMVVLWHKVVPLELYLLAPVLAIGGVSIAMVVFSFLIAFNDKSEKLQTHFLKMIVRSSSQFQLKDRKKVLRAARKIQLTYGGCGTFTRQTRTDYFHTLVVNSANAVIATEMVGAS